jgi:hypothetical protein
MFAYLRLSAIAAAFLAVPLVACSGPQTSGSAGTQTASAGYMVPPGYVSGEKVLMPYAGRIQSKCEHATSEYQRTTCIQQER